MTFHDSDPVSAALDRLTDQVAELRATIKKIDRIVDDAVQAASGIDDDAWFDAVADISDVLHDRDTRTAVGLPAKESGDNQPT